jgi:hypothetical protein
MYKDVGRELCTRTLDVNYVQGHRTVRAKKKRTRTFARAQPAVHLSETEDSTDVIATKGNYLRDQQYNGQCITMNRWTSNDVSTQVSRTMDWSVSRTITSDSTSNYA